MPCINCKLVTYYLKGCDFCSFTGNNLLNNLYTHFLIHIGRTYSKWRFLKHYEHMNSYILINKKFTRNPKTDIYITLLRLSPLEIQEFDAIGKNEHEEDNPAYMSSSNNGKEIIVKTQVLFKEFLQSHASSTWYLQFCIFVTQL